MLLNPSLTASLSHYGVSLASSTTLTATHKWRSHHASLDDFFDGGLPFGAVTEWGLPFGRGGREMIMAFLSSATQGRPGTPPLLALWISQPSTQFSVYPPGWSARGVDLRRVRFATSSKPLAELKPLFLNPLFKVIVLDAPASCTSDDLALVARQARLQGQAVLLLRNYLLSEERGNVWAKLRVNAWQVEGAQRYHLKSLRGLSPRQTVIDLSMPAFEGYL